MGNIAHTMKVLNNYTTCKDKKCKSAILLKKVYKDLNYIPLCSNCRSKHRRAINRFKKECIALSDKEIIDVYFESLNLT